MFIRPFDAAMDETRLLDLWAAVFGDNWPITPSLVRKQAVDVDAYRPGDHILVEEDGKPVGFSLTQLGTDTPATGAILALGCIRLTGGRGWGEHCIRQP